MTVGRALAFGSAAMTAGLAGYKLIEEVAVNSRFSDLSYYMDPRNSEFTSLFYLICIAQVCGSLYSSLFPVPHAQVNPVRGPEFSSNSEGSSNRRLF